MRLILFTLLSAALHIPADAQDLPPQKRKVATYDYDFVRGENVVFFDDFNGYEDSTKPYRWNMLREVLDNNVMPATKAFTKRIDSFQSLYFKYGNGDLAAPAWDTTGYSGKYSNNYWSIDFDFKLIVTPDNSGNYIGISIGDTSGGLMVGFQRWWGDGFVTKETHDEVFCMSSYRSKRSKNYYHTDRVDYPVAFNSNIWHHFALALSPRAITGYVDRCKFMTIPGPYEYIPSLSLNGRAKVAIKNFMIARTDSAHRKTPEEQTRINTLLTERTFTTHAITFDKGKAEIKPQSMSIINQLVTLLKANPAVRLQINGHTDSDGTPASNTSLSLKRAEAIKNKLVSMGIAAGRLQVKGLGATQPITSNDTPAGREQNRRVEFVKL